jgi:hypothetical protein
MTVVQIFSGRFVMQVDGTEVRNGFCDSQDSRRMVVRPSRSQMFAQSGESSAVVSTEELGIVPFK